MRKQLIVLFLLCWEVWAYSGGIERAEDGRFSVEKLKFGLIICKSKTWSSVEQQQPGVVSFLGEGGEKTKDGLRRDGEFKLSENMVLKLTEVIDRISDREVRIQYTLSSDAETSTELFAYQTEIPKASYQMNPILVDGKAQIFSGKENQISVSGKTVQIPLSHGVLEIRGAKRQVIITQNSWGTVRVRLVFGYRKWKSAKLDITLRYTPYGAKTVDMATVMNMGFKDDLADDRKGGWTDQGPENDLSAMKSGLQTLDGIPFFIVDPSKNQSVSCLAMKGPQRPYFSEKATVSVPGYTGKTLYLLNGLAWAPKMGTAVGRVVVVYSDGDRQEFTLKCDEDTGNFWNPRKLKHANVVWSTQNRNASIGLYASRLPLKPKAVSSLEFVSCNQVWMILAATIGTLEEPNDGHSDIVMRANRDWAPLPFLFETEKGSAADLSFLLEAPAGKYGFLKVQGSHFEFGKRPGRPVVFWGCNIATKALYAPPETTRRMLDDMAACGYNIVRLHHFDWDLTTRKGAVDQILPERLEKLDFFFAEAKKRGIYITLDLFTLRWPKIPKYGQLNPGDYKRLCYFDDEVRQDLLRISKGLLGHKNSYTGLRWADDPALVMINLINEGTLPVLVARLNKRCQPVVDAAFARYVSERKLNVTDANRQPYFDAFLTFTGKRFFDDMKQSLAAIGVKIPLCDQNFAEPAGDTRAHYDYVDTHFYWCHPTYIGKELWKLPSFTPASSPISVYAGGINNVFKVRIAGKPMVVSEWNYCYPNPYIFTGAFLTAGYAAFQDFSGLMQFCYAGREDDTGPKPLGQFLLATNPIYKLASRAGALFFLRRDVSSPAKEAVLISDKAAGFLGSYLPLLMRIGKVSAQSPAGIPLVTAPDEDIRLPGRISIRRTGDDRFFTALQQAGISAPLHGIKADGTVVSSTGELRLNARKEQFQIITPRSEAAVVAPKQKLKGSFLGVENGNAPAVVFAGSLDGETLTSSDRILLLHLTDIKSAGAVFADKSMTILKDFGGKQLLIRRNKAEVELAYSRPCKIYACEYSGKRLYEIPTIRKNGKLLFSLDNFTKGKTVLLYELVKNQ